jgi:hypothetical protein
MTTSAVVLNDTWQQITDGTQNYVVQLTDMLGDNSAKMTLSEATPDGSSPFFTLKEGEGFSHITHPGKLWARENRGEQVVLVVNK